MQTRSYYEPSGQFSPAGILIGILLATSIAVVGAVVYAYAVVYIPSPKLDCLACAAFGLLLGAACAYFMRRPGKVRSVKLTMLLTLVITAVGYYVCWVVWLWIVFNRGDPDFSIPLGDLAGHPHLVVAAVQDVYQNGTWKMTESDTDSTKGTALGIIWLGEALLIFVPALMVAHHMAAAAPFCEKCGQWCGKPELIRQTDLTDETELKRRLERGDFAYVAALPPAVAGKNMLLRFSRSVCGTCNDFQSLDVQRITRKKTKKKETESKVTVVKKLLVTPADINAIKPVVAT
jgi:hypothetical protein